MAHTHADPIDPSLDRTREAIATRLHAPRNLGVELRPLHLGQRRLLAGYIRGLADEEYVRQRGLEPVLRLTREEADRVAADPALLQERLPAPRTRLAESLNEAVAGLLEGATALFIDGAPRALLIYTEAAPPSLGGPKLPPGSFGSDLMQNLSMIRRHLRNADLIAEPFLLPGDEPPHVAVLSIHGRTTPSLVTRVETWLQKHGRNEAFHNGAVAGAPARFGLLPTLASTVWPGRAVALLDQGYVVVLVDQVGCAFLAPVTAASQLYDPGDDLLRRPVLALKRFIRLGLIWLVLISGALVVAVMEYHQELLPTPFLLALAAVRETAALPVVATMMALEALGDLVWIISFRLQLMATVGQMVAVYVMIVVLLTLTGLTGPLPAAAAVVTMLATMGLPSYDLVFTARVWRWAFLAGAILFGLFGMAVVAYLMMAYATQHESFGVPFIGERGTRLAPLHPPAGGQQRKERGL